MKTYSKSSISLLVLAAACPNLSAALTEAEFFNPDFTVQPAIGLGIGFSSSDFATDTQSSGPMTWTHLAQGHTWANLTVDLGLGTVDLAEVHLAAFTETVDDSLVFGRSQTVDILGAISAGEAVGNLSTAGLVNSWGSTAVIDMDLVANEIYNLQFTVTSPALVSADLLGSAVMGFSDVDLFMQPSGSALLPLNLLGLADIDLITGSALVSIPFVPNTDLDSLSLDFAAESLVGLDVLGSNGDGTQNVMSFSGFSVTPVPEPSALSLAGLGLIGLMRRQRSSK